MLQQAPGFLPYNILIESPCFLSISSHPKFTHYLTLKFILHLMNFFFFFYKETTLSPHKKGEKNNWKEPQSREDVVSLLSSVRLTYFYPSPPTHSTLDLQWKFIPQQNYKLLYIKSTNKFQEPIGKYCLLPWLLWSLNFSIKFKIDPWRWNII